MIVVVQYLEGSAVAPWRHFLERTFGRASNLRDVLRKVIE
jgi:hypothetical protein